MFMLRYIFLEKFDGDAAYKVLVKHSSSIKKCFNALDTLTDKLFENRIISEADKKKIEDDYSGWTEDRRISKLLEFLRASVELDGDVFGIFIEIIREHDTRGSDQLAKLLLQDYETQKSQCK